MVQKKCVIIWMLAMALPLVMLAQTGQSQQENATTATIISSTPLSDTLQAMGAQPDSGFVSVRTIIIQGNRKTRDEIVVRELAIQPNTTYKGKDFNEKVRLTREQLMNTRLFISVDINWNAVPLSNEVDLLVDVKERWYFFPVPYFKVVDRNWNVWINDYKASLSRTNYGVKLFHTNLTGRNDKLDAYLISGYTQQVELRYQLPFADKKLEKGYSVGLSYGRNRELNYATDSNRQQFANFENFGRQYFRADLDFSYRKGSQQRIFARAGFGMEKIDSQFYYLNPNYINFRTKATYLDLAVSYQYYNVDYIPFPLRGWYVEFDGLHRFSRGIPMTAFGGRMQAAWQFLPKTFVSFQSAFKWIFPSEQPYYNQKLMGYGSLYMQGLEYFVMDGSLGIMGRTTLRRELFTLTFRGPDSWKAYSKIPFRFFAKTYGNLGYAYNKHPGTNYMNNRLLRTAGFGLEVATIYDFVMKLEYSFNQFGQSGFFIHSSSDF